MNRKVCGEFPEFCYKAFDREEYAKQFVEQGSFRMNCRFYCRHLSGPRQDPTEGDGHTLEPGIMTVALVSQNPAEETIWIKQEGHQDHHIDSGNATFIFSTCSPEVQMDRLRIFGDYIVRIESPRQLADDISTYFENKGKKFIVEGCHVIYSKGEKLDKPLSQNERLDTPYKQKPRVKNGIEYYKDCEFRIVAIKFGEPCPSTCKYLDGEFDDIEPACKFIEIRLERRLDYVSIVSSR